MDTPVIYTAHVLIIQNNRVLLVKHGASSGHLNNVYGIPGGRMNEGEDLIHAAAREFAEETGLQIKSTDLKSFPDNTYTSDILRKTGEVRRFTMTVFFCKTFTGSLKSTDETVPEWIDVSALKIYNLLPNVQKAIDDSRPYWNK